jgi:hypothetical protein
MSVCCLRLKCHGGTLPTPPQPARQEAKGTKPDPSAKTYGENR